MYKEASVRDETQKMITGAESLSKGPSFFFFFKFSRRGSGFQKTKRKRFIYKGK
jgi:hypothetical protein